MSILYSSTCNFKMQTLSKIFTVSETPDIPWTFLECLDENVEKHPMRYPLHANISQAIYTALLQFPLSVNRAHI